MNNLTPTAHHISSSDRKQRQGHSGAVIWLTGLPGSGKSTIAMNLELKLFELGYSVYVLDGDNIRYGLNSDLGFSLKDRHENIRRVGEVAGLFADAGFICISAFISPFQIDRDNARKAVHSGDFYEVHIKANLAECEKRDPKGLYRKARAGLISDMTGIDSPYEPPALPDLVIDTENNSINACVDKVCEFVLQRTNID